MSVNRNVLLECDGRDGTKMCWASFSYGTTNLRTTREAAEAEGWSTGFERNDPDYCPKHAGQDITRVTTEVKPAADRPPMWSAIAHLFRGLRLA